MYKFHDIAIAGLALFPGESKGQISRYRNVGRLLYLLGRRKLSTDIIEQVKHIAIQVLYTLSHNERMYSLSIADVWNVLNQLKHVKSRKIQERIVKLYMQNRTSTTTVSNQQIAIVATSSTSIAESKVEEANDLNEEDTVLQSYCYLLQSEQVEKVYIGCSQDPFRRLLQHNAGRTAQTRSHKPWKILLIVGPFHQRIQANNVIKQ